MARSEMKDNREKNIHLQFFEARPSEKQLQKDQQSFIYQGKMRVDTILKLSGN